MGFAHTQSLLKDASTQKSWLTTSMEMELTIHATTTRRTMESETLKQEAAPMAMTIPTSMGMESTMKTMPTWMEMDNSMNSIKISTEMELTIHTIKILTEMES